MCSDRNTKLETRRLARRGGVKRISGPGTGKPLVAMFDECVAPLVEGLFQCYNAMVLTYGQTYTMGTTCKEGVHALPMQLTCTRSLEQSHHRPLAKRNYNFTTDDILRSVLELGRMWRNNLDQFSSA